MNAGVDRGRSYSSSLFSFEQQGRNQFQLADEKSSIFFLTQMLKKKKY